MAEEEEEKGFEQRIVEQIRRLFPDSGELPPIDRIRGMSDGEIERKAEELQKRLVILKSKNGQERLDNPHLITNVRKTIARLKTVKNGRE